MDIREIESRAEEFRIVNLRVMQHGKEILSRDWGEEIRRNQFSVSKSFTSIAVGMACSEGLLDLHESLCDAFSEEIPDNPSANLQKATIRDLLTMCLGQDASYLMGEQRTFIEEKDWVRYILSRPFADEPGTRFLYSNAGPYLAGILVQRRSGTNLLDYLMPRLFAPLGIRRTIWEVDPDGFVFGSGGLFLSISEVMKAAQLLLQHGSWNGKQLISDSYIREATKMQADNGAEGYGYLYWRGPYNSYRMDGKYGQIYIVLEDKDAVIGINAESQCAKEMRNCCMDVIVPQL